jgi:hypothetical protein
LAENQVRREQTYAGYEYGISNFVLDDGQKSHGCSRTVVCTVFAGSASAKGTGKNGLTVDGRIIGKPVRIGGIEINGTRRIVPADVRDVAIVLTKKAGHIS